MRALQVLQPLDADTVFVGHPVPLSTCEYPLTGWADWNWSMDFEEFAEAVTRPPTALRVPKFALRVRIKRTKGTDIRTKGTDNRTKGTDNRCSKVFRTILIRNPQKKAASVDDMSARHSALILPAFVTHQRNGWHAKYSSSFVVV